MKKILFLLVLGIVKISFAQTGLHFQWHKQGLYGTPFFYHKDTLVNICRVGQNVSNPNTIAFLNPNTSTWSYLNSPISPSVYPTTIMKDRMNGAIYTNTNNFYITTDGWQTSTLHTTLTTLPYDATKFGYLSYTSTSPYGLQFSSNGISWTSVTSVTNYPYFVKGNNKLFVLDGDKLLASVNGGSSYSTTTYTATMGSGKLYAANDDTLFIMSSNNFKTSFDGGLTWNIGALPSTTLNASNLVCKNGKELMLYMVSSNLSQKSYYYSNNSGVTWTLLTGLPVFGISDQLIATSKYFMMYPSYRTIDGTTWTQDVFPKVKAGAMDLDFRANVGLVGFAQGYFAYSTNRGASFEISSTKIGNQEDVMAVKVLPGNKFLVGDRKGSVYESSDLGQTWTPRFVNTVSNINAIKFMYSQNTNTIICQRYGQPLMSTDGGVNYSIVTVGGGNHAQAQRPVSGDMIDVGGAFPAPNFTLAAWEINKVDINGTKTLLATITPTTNMANEYISAIHMADDNTGYFFSYNSFPTMLYIYKTTNNWQNVTLVSSIPTSTTAPIIGSGKIQTIGTDTIFFSSNGNSGTGNLATNYFRSTDGGLNWTSVNTNFSVPNANLGNKIYRTHFFNINEYMALIADLNGTASTSTGAYLSTNGVAGNPVPNGINEFVKANNDSRVKIYPNPTAFSFNLQSENYFNRIEVYNMEGQLIKAVDTDFVKEFELETNDMKSGIYFVKIYSGNKLAGQNKLVVFK